MSKNKFSITLILILIFSLFGVVSTIHAQEIGQNPCVGNIAAVKQREMLETVVLVGTHCGSGSGVIIDCLETDTEGVFEYRVLTNAHVTSTRLIPILQSVNSLTGKVKIETIDTGCNITVFDNKEKKTYRYSSEVIDEDSTYDFAILSFRTEQKIDVARIANEQMLERVRVFDEVFAIGCPFGKAPSPTTGIISMIIIDERGEKEWVIYGNTAQIVPGSSGGGLFKKYDGHYYLIGIPFNLRIAGNGQMIPHLSRAIAISTAIDFINENTVTYP